MPPRDVRSLPGRLAELVAGRLVRVGVRASLIEAETTVMRPVVVGPTVDRSVLGIMVDFAKGVRYYLEDAHWNDGALRAVEDQLAETPCHAGKLPAWLVFPDKKTPELLAARWAG